MKNYTLQELELSIQVAKQKYHKALSNSADKLLLKVLKEDIESLERLKQEKQREPEGDSCSTK